MKKNTKQRLFEVMGRLDPSFKKLNEVGAFQYEFNSEYDEMKKHLIKISDEENIINEIDGEIRDENSWILIVMGGVNSNYGAFYLEVENDGGDYNLKIRKSYRDEGGINEYFDSFEELVDYLNQFFQM